MIWEAIVRTVACVVYSRQDVSISIRSKKEPVLTAAFHLQLSRSDGLRYFPVPTSSPGRLDGWQRLFYVYARLVVVDAVTGLLSYYSYVNLSHSDHIVAPCRWEQASTEQSQELEKLQQRPQHRLHARSMPFDASSLHPHTAKRLKLPLATRLAKWDTTTKMLWGSKARCSLRTKWL